MIKAFVIIELQLTIKADGMRQSDQGNVILQPLWIPGGIDLEVLAGHHQSHLAFLLGVLDFIGSEEDQSPFSPARYTNTVSRPLPPDGARPATVSDLYTFTKIRVLSVK